MEENQRMTDKERPLEMACAIFTLPISSAMRTDSVKSASEMETVSVRAAASSASRAAGVVSEMSGMVITPLQERLCM